MATATLLDYGATGVVALLLVAITIRLRPMARAHYLRLSRVERSPRASRG